MPINIGGITINEDGTIMGRIIDFEPVKQERCEFCKDGKTFLGAVLVLGNDGNWHSIRYCPNCGAKMDEDLQWEESEINPCRGCEDYDGQGGCLSKGGCGERREDAKTD